MPDVLKILQTGARQTRAFPACPGFGAEPQRLWIDNPPASKGRCGTAVTSGRFLRPANLSRFPPGGPISFELKQVTSTEISLAAVQSQNRPRTRMAVFPAKSSPAAPSPGPPQQWGGIQTSTAGLAALPPAANFTLLVPVCFSTAFARIYL